MNSHLVVTQSSSTIDECARMLSKETALSCILVADADGKVAGVITRDAALRALSGSDRTSRLDASITRDYVTVAGTDSLLEIMTRMRAHHARVTLVTDGARPLMLDHVKGVITIERLADAMAEAAELLSD